MQKIILASGSPRRKQLLDQVGIRHEVVVSNADETIEGLPDYQVRELALRKAKAVYEITQGDVVIIAADTLVCVDDEVLGKPSNPDDAFSMLKKLQGRRHTVYTGVAVMVASTGQTESFVDTTQVYFRELSDNEIWTYIATGEPFDKAGAYGVQERGALLVDHVVGDFYTVVGLPVAKLAATLRDFNIAI